MIYVVASLVFLLFGYSIAFGSWENDSVSKRVAFLFQMAFVGKTINMHDLAGPTLIHSTAALVVFAVDDPVGALSVHLVNGIWGTLAVGIFGLGEDISLRGQIKGIIIVAVIAFTLSYAALKLIDKFFPFRADDETQIEGLDQSECGLESYPEFVRS